MIKCAHVLCYSSSIEVLYNTPSHEGPILYNEDMYGDPFYLCESIQKRRNVTAPSI